MNNKINILRILFFLVSVFSGCTITNQKDDLRIIKERIISLGTGNGIPSEGSYKKQTIEEMESSAQSIFEEGSHLQSLDPSGRGYESKVSGVYRRILTLAKAFNTPGQKFYHSDTLKLEIIKSLHNGVSYTKPGSPHPGNWYFWEIATPMSFGQTLVMMQDYLEDSVMQEQLIGLHNLNTLGPNLHGSNSVFQGVCQLYYAILTQDKEKLAAAMDIIDIELAVADKETGILEDYSYQFHNQLLYTGGYGAHFANNAATVIYITKGTSYTPAPEKVEIFNKYLVEHVQWVINRGYFDLSVKGRELGRSPRAGLTPFLLMASYPSDYQEQLKVITNRLLYYHHGRVSLEDAPFVDQYPNPADTPLNGVRYFYKVDYGVARRPDFYVSVKMFSDHTMDYEYLTGQNKNGRNLCSGLTYFGRSGNELWAYNRNLETVYDWEHLPGTTARFDVRPPKPSNLSKSNFAGGAGSEENGIMAFKLVPVVDDFYARKSYFMFPKGFVALGSDITSNKQGAEVSTTITQWGMSGKDKLLVLSNGEDISLTENKEFESLDWAYCDSVGYIFHDCANINFKKDSLFTTIYLDHGAHPQQEKYAYTILPACSHDEIIAYSKSTEIEILENSDAIHALRDIENKATGIVFWKPGSFEKIAVDHEAIVYYEEKADGSLALTVSNPLYNQDTVTITLNKRFGRYDLPEEARANVTGNSTIITLKTANRRLYRIGLGDVKVEQFPREDNLSYESFKIVNVETKGRNVYLTLQIPEAALKGYRLMVHQEKSHFETELYPSDITDTISSGVFTYLWKNPGKPDSGRPIYKVRLISGIHNVIETFKVEGIYSCELRVESK